MEGQARTKELAANRKYSEVISKVAAATTLLRKAREIEKNSYIKLLKLAEVKTAYVGPRSW